MRLAVLFLTGVLLTAVAASATDSCNSQLKRVGAAARPLQFWRQTSPVLVTAHGAEFPLTFSLDSEIPYTSWMKYLPELPNISQLMRTAHCPTTFDVDEIARRTQMSPAQIPSFVLRRNTDKSKDRFTILDINASYMPDCADCFVAGVGAIVGEALPDLQHFLDAKSVLLKATKDGDDVELIHPSYTTIPNNFRTLLDQLNSLFKSPSTHFHIGLPMAIGRERNLAIARAIETLIVLDLAREWPSSSYAHAFQGTTFEDGVNTEDSSGADAGVMRGLVRFEHLQWYKPHTTDNLEIRQYHSLAHGLSLLELAAQLAIRHERILLVPTITFDGVFNDQVGMISAAFQYLAALWRVSPDLSKRNLVPELERMHALTIATPKTDAPLSLRREVADFVTANRLTSRLTFADFLSHSLDF